MGDDSKIRSFYYGTLDGSEWHKINNVEDIEQPETEEIEDKTRIVGDLGEVELSFELDKRTILKLRWMFFKQHIRVAFSVLFGKGNI